MAESPMYNGVSATLSEAFLGIYIL